MSRKKVIPTRKLAVVIVSESWPSSSQVGSKKIVKNCKKICFALAPIVNYANTIVRPKPIECSWIFPIIVFQQN